MLVEKEESAAKSISGCFAIFGGPINCPHPHIAVSLDYIPPFLGYSYSPFFVPFSLLFPASPSLVSLLLIMLTASSSRHTDSLELYHGFLYHHQLKWILNVAVGWPH